MAVRLRRVGTEKAEFIWRMQVEAFSGLYAKYQDTETSPATETVSKVRQRLEQPSTYYYLIESEDTVVGAIRVVDQDDLSLPKRISPIFVLEQYRGQGIGSKTLVMDTAI